MTDRVLIRAVDGTSASAMMHGELAYVPDTGGLVLGGFGGIPTAPLDPSVAAEAAARIAADALLQPLLGFTPYNASNPAGYQTAANVAAVVPSPGTTNPLVDGTAAPGAATDYARKDHVHPTDTSRYAASNPSSYQTAADVSATVSATFASPPALGAIMLTPGGPTWTTGAAAPTATEPVGSLYSRVGGAVGATLYVSRGAGTWAAVAGV